MGSFKVRTGQVNYTNFVNEELVCMSYSISLEPAKQPEYSKCPLLS